MGRPTIHIDWVQFEELCGLFCTELEIAEWFRCSVDTINRACIKNYGETFAETFKKKSSKGKTSLRRRQFELALDGNVALLIFLGKQYLGQTDKVEQVDKDGETPRLVVTLNKNG